MTGPRLLPVTLIALTACEPLRVAALNTSAYDYEGLEFGEVVHGDLASGEQTPFTEVDYAYETTYVAFTIDDVGFGLVPSDYFGERPVHSTAATGCTTSGSRTPRPAPSP